MVQLRTVVGGQCVLLLIGPETINPDGRQVLVCMGQHVVMKLLADEGVKPLDIHRKLPT